MERSVCQIRVSIGFESVGCNLVSGSLKTISFVLLSHESGVSHMHACMHTIQLVLRYTVLCWMVKSFSSPDVPVILMQFFRAA